MISSDGTRLTFVLSGIAAMVGCMTAVLATCPKTYHKDYDTKYTQLQITCKTGATNNVNASINTGGNNTIGGSVSGSGSMDAVCLISYQLVDFHGECASDAATGNVRCVTDGTYNVTTWSGGGCHEIRGALFDELKGYDCKTLTKETPSTRTNKTTESC